MQKPRRKALPAWWRALRESGVALGLAIFIVSITTWIALQFIEPAPPRHLTIATGSADGAYRRFGEQLREVLKAHDVTLTVLETEGSIDNLQRLQQGSVDIGFAQSGLASPGDFPTIDAFGAMYFEPVWIFSRSDAPFERLNELTGKTIATGGAGSGTRRVATHLLAENGLTEADITLSEHSGLQAIEALRSGQVDVIVSVASISAPMIETALEDATLSLVSMSRAAAYARREPWLTHLTLPEGVVDLARNLPDQSVDLLAVNATLLGTDTLHPALRDLLLIAADEVFSPATLLSSHDQFPSATGSDFPLNDQARRYHEHGPPFLQRYLPFWVANLIDRFKLLALPLLALILPLSRLMPPAYRWTVRRKIYRWYDQVQDLDQAASEDASPEHLKQCLSELLDIEKDVRQLQVPLSFANELYTLRHHIDMLTKQIVLQLSDASGKPAGAASAFIRQEA